MIKSINLQQVKRDAEKYYRDGDFYCSEAIVKTIKDSFDIPCSDDVIKLASGFPVGIGGSGCTCGAITGGVMAIGLVFGRTQAKDPSVEITMELSKKLYDKFIENHKTSCCKILTHNMEMGSTVHMNQCVSFTGEVAYEVAGLIAEKLGLDVE